MSTTDKFTPGPWKAMKARKSSNFGGRTAFVQAPVSVDGKPTFYFTVAKALGVPQDLSELAEANATLIAAAPTMLEALRKIERLEFDFTSPESAADVVRAAIALATGDRL